MKMNNFEAGDLVEFKQQYSGKIISGIVVSKRIAKSGIELHDVMEASGELHTKTEMYLRHMLGRQSKGE
jgi:hypothetical protein